MVQQTTLEGRNAKIIREWLKGVSLKELAQRFGLSRSHINNIVWLRRPRCPKK